MTEEIGLRPRTGSAEAPPAHAEPDPTPIVESPQAAAPEAQSPLPQPATEMSLVHYLDEPLWRVKGWIQLMGVLFILNGVLAALSLWGILLCWLPIWLGLTLMSAAKNIRAAGEYNDQKCMRLALEKLGLYFKINGVLVVIAVVFGILVGAALVLGLLGSVAMLSPGMQSMLQ